ncbi:hypothetical protein V1507DRAFT_247001 [Lipomyces tetrasporus]
MAQFTLQEAFGTVPSVCSRYIQRGLEMLLDFLKTSIPGAKILWPKTTDLERYAMLIRNQHPIPENAFGSVDGLHLPVEAADDMEIQNAYYNGWVHSHFPPTCSCSLLWEQSCTWRSTRQETCMTRACVARELYQKLHHETAEGYWLIADSAFPTSNGLRDKIGTPLKSKFSVETNNSMLYIDPL